MNTEKVTRGILLIYQKCRITLSLNNRSVLFVYCFGLVSAPFLLEVPTTYPLIITMKFAKPRLRLSLATR